MAAIFAVGIVQLGARLYSGEERVKVRKVPEDDCDNFDRTLDQSVKGIDV